MKRFIASMAGPLALVCYAYSAESAITYSTTTNKPRYLPGEALLVDITAFNSASQDVTLGFPTLAQAAYTMDGMYRGTMRTGDAVSYQVIPASGSYTWSLPHRWDAYSPAFGQHNVVGEVLQHSQAGDASFEVVQPTLPTESFLIDFDTLPDGGRPIRREEYWPYGVRFSGDIRQGSNGYIDGSNLVADFDMPIRGVTVDVGSAVGRTVTVTAKDIEGNVLATATSGLISEVGSFLPVTLHADGDIRSVEWRASGTGALVRVDNVFIYIPEPGVPSLGGIALAALRGGVRGGDQSNIAS